MAVFFARFFMHVEADTKTMSQGIDGLTGQFSMKEWSRQQKEGKVSGGGGGGSGAARGSAESYLNGMQEVDNGQIPEELMAMGERFAQMLPDKELSMAKLSGYLMKWDRPEQALERKNIQELLCVSKDAQVVKEVRIYDHLRRVGLEHLAPWFEAHNIRFKHQLDGIDAALTKTWCWELSRNDGRCFDQLKRLLSHDKELQTNDYQTANITTIRDAFMTSFPVDSVSEWQDTDLRSQGGGDGGEGGKGGKGGKNDGESKSAISAIEPHHLLRVSLPDSFDEFNRSTTAVLSRGGGGGGGGGDGSQLALPPTSPPLLRSLSGEAMAIVRRLTELSQRLVETVTTGGKVKLSLWQLRWLLAQHDDPEDLIAAAQHMVDTRMAGQSGLNAAVPLSTYVWLKKAGLAKYSAIFEERGMSLASKVVADVKDMAVLKQTVPSMSNDERDFMLKLIQNKPEHSSDTVGASCPDKSSVVSMFWGAYGPSNGGKGGGESKAGESKTGDKAESKGGDTADATAAAAVATASASADAAADTSTNAGAATSASASPASARTIFEAAVEFSRRVSTKAGRSLVSSIELAQHFKRHAGSDWRGALETYSTELLAPPKVKAPTAPPPPPPSACWVHKALRVAEGNYDSVAAKLLDADITSKDDLLCDPGLSPEELKTMGLKLGEARRLTRLVVAFKSGEIDAGIPEAGDVLECPLYGDGIVVAFDEASDVYVLGSCYVDKHMNDGCDDRSVSVGATDGEQVPVAVEEDEEKKEGKGEGKQGGREEEWEPSRPGEEQ